MISLLLPSRGRPQLFKRFIDSAFGLADNPSQVEVVARLDFDDPQYGMYHDVIGDHRNVHLVLDKRNTNLTQCWNDCFKYAKGDILGHMGDDIVFRNPQGWDTLLEGVFAQSRDKIILAYGRDGITDEHYASHSFIHRVWTEGMGYFLPPYLASDFGDMWLDELARMLGRRVFLPEFSTEHMHVSTGKMEVDDNARERMKRYEEAFPDPLVFYAEKKDERLADVEKLKALIR